MKNSGTAKDFHSELIDKIQAAVVVHDADTKIVCSNRKAQKLLGLTEEQMLGRTAFDPIWEFLRADKKKMTADQYPVNQVLTTKKTLRDCFCGLPHPSKTDDVLWMIINADPVFDDRGEIQQIIVTFLDITTLKQTEAALREQTSTLKNIMEKAADGICVCHNIPEEPYVRFTHWNPRMTDITGYSIDEINTFGWYQTVYPDPEIGKLAIEKMARMREGEDLHSEEWVITTKDGEEKPLSISTSIVKKINGETHVLAIMKDISKRKQAEDALKESQKKYQDILEKSDDIIWTTDIDLNTLYISPSIEKKLGFTPEERVAQRLDEQMPFSSYKAVMERLALELEREQKENVDPDRTIRIEVEYYHKNGPTLWFENIASGIRDENGSLIGIHGISRDISDRKLAEEALLAEKNKLQAALAEIKKLSGLLPICSFCKKIRDDYGYWSQLEEYITKRSEAQFSHGICPECVKRHYAELDSCDE